MKSNLSIYKKFIENNKCIRTNDMLGNGLVYFLERAPFINVCLLVHNILIPHSFATGSKKPLYISFVSSTIKQYTYNFSDTNSSENLYT